MWSRRSCCLLWFIPAIQAEKGEELGGALAQEQPAVFRCWDSKEVLSYDLSKTLPVDIALASSCFSLPLLHTGYKSTVSLCKPRKLCLFF